MSNLLFLRCCRWESKQWIQVHSHWLFLFSSH